MLKPPSPAPVLAPIPFWKRIPKWLFALLGMLGVLIGIIQSYPWLSIEESGLLDPANPYSEMFKAKNTGYLPVTSLFVTCASDTTIGTNVFHNVSGTLPLADYLGHEGTVTVPCFRLFQTGGDTVSSGSILTITISYAIVYLNWQMLRRSQKFKFKSIVGADNSQHWIFIS